MYVSFDQYKFTLMLCTVSIAIQGKISHSWFVSFTSLSFGVLFTSGPLCTICMGSVFVVSGHYIHQAELREIYMLSGIINSDIYTWSSTSYRNSCNDSRYIFSMCTTSILKRTTKTFSINVALLLY